MSLLIRVLSWRYHGAISFPLRVYIGGVFLYACVHKILNPASFAIDVATYQILPLWLVNVFAIILPWVELVAGVFIIAGFRTKASALLISVMMAMFLVAVIIALSKGLHMSCGCFASQSMEESPISSMTVVRDLIWLIVSVYILIFDNNLISIERKWLKSRRKE